MLYQYYKSATTTASNTLSLLEFSQNLAVFGLLKRAKREDGRKSVRATVTADKIPANRQAVVAFEAAASPREQGQV